MVDINRQRYSRPGFPLYVLTSRSAWIEYVAVTAPHVYYALGGALLGYTRGFFNANTHTWVRRPRQLFSTNSQYFWAQGKLYGGLK